MSLDARRGAAVWASLRYVATFTLGPWAWPGRGAAALDAAAPSPFQWSRELSTSPWLNRKAASHGSGARAARPRARSHSKDARPGPPGVPSELLTYGHLDRAASDRGSQAATWTASDREWLATTLNAVFDDARLQALAPKHSIGVALVGEHKKAFARWLYTHLTANARLHLRQLQAHRRADLVAALFPLLRDYLEAKHWRDVEVSRALLQVADMSKPHTWFPLARGLRRRVVYHAGPTNSGKTYRALQALKAARSGVYCGPLRLLAVEVGERLNREGVPCDVLTGQERLEVAGATHTACTVEMATLGEVNDVAVIDEIQMLADHSRGWAWTKALLGLPAAEVHVCGDHSCLALVQSLCAAMDSPLEVHKYERLTQLQLDQQGLGPDGYSAVQPGDCIVAFSRRDLYRIKREIDCNSPHKAAIIYGALPPHSRKAQAALFNDPASDHQVLVASDAIGMGLNLNIRRIIFHTLKRFSSVSGSLEPLQPSHIKQIAGRAGRKGTAWENGLAGTRFPSDLPRLASALALPMDALTCSAAGLLPEFEQVEAYAMRRGFPEACSLLELLEHFALEAQTESLYVMCNQESMLKIAEAIHTVEPLTLRERYTFCTAPVHLQNPGVLSAFLGFVRRYAEDGSVPLETRVPSRPPASWSEVSLCESAYQVISVWLWLAQRFAHAFPGREAAKAAEVQLAELISQGLAGMDSESDVPVETSEEFLSMLPNLDAAPLPQERQSPHEASPQRHFNSGKFAGRGGHKQQARARATA